MFIFCSVTKKKKKLKQIFLLPKLPSQFLQSGEKNLSSLNPLDLQPQSSLTFEKSRSVFLTRSWRNEPGKEKKRKVEKNENGKYSLTMENRNTS